MKQTTKEWLIAAEDDILSAKKLIDEERLTNIVAFHCQQCLEKTLKAIIEEKNIPSIKSHDLLRLINITNIQLDENSTLLLSTINEVYIDARYPAEIGLMPNGKPTKTEAQNFIEFSEKFFLKIRTSLKQPPDMQ